MKKLLAGIISAILVLSAGLIAVAAETVPEQNSNKEIDVQAKAVYISPENIYAGTVSDGKVSIETSGGATISVDGGDAIRDGLTLNVIEMVNSDQEAYTWISEIMDGVSDQFTAYDIYFTDQNGKHIDITGEVTVSITTPEGYTKVQVFHITADGEREKLASTQAGGSTVFAAKGFSYYLLANTASDSGTTNPTESEKPTDSDAPQTGDTSNMALWLALLFMSFGALTTIIIMRKNIETNSK